MVQAPASDAQRRKSPPPSRPLILVVSRGKRVRAETAAAIRALGEAREIAPAALRRSSALIDAVAAIVCLTGRTDERRLDELSPLRDLPAGRAILLVVKGVPDEDLEAAIGRLEPFLVLPRPLPDCALRLALARCLPQSPAGEGSRRQHRRAPALLGVSSAIREVLQQVTQVAPTRVPVLILGETGTGKELVARAIHEQSPRAARPFVAVNCSALPDSLLEAELFGARRGAYTGADRDREGLFVEADGGTLFLDEIGDTSPSFQAKLLRAIETQEVRPLGGTQARRVDVRIVSATHRDLKAAMAEGSFREDLFYRLNTVAIEVPPLRRRRVDIPFLAQHFAEEFGDAQARRIVLAEDLLEEIIRHEFPGNVRELRNAVERALALASPESTVTARHLQIGDAPDPRRSALRPGKLRERVQQIEIEAIQEALTVCEGNRTRAADALGISRLGLREKMRRLGLEPEPQR